MLYIRDYADPLALCDRSADGDYDRLLHRLISVSTSGGAVFTGVLIENTRDLITLAAHIRPGCSTKSHIVKAYITALRSH